MNTKTFRLWAAVLLTAALLLPTIVLAQTGRSNFDWIVVRRLTVGTGDITAQDDVTVTDDVTINDDLTVVDDALLGELNLTAAAIITPTQGGTLSPGGSFQRLSAGDAVSFGAITAGTAGDVLVLYNTVNQTITISDTGALKLTGNIALGQFDSLTLISDGTNWVMLSTANN